MIPAPDKIIACPNCDALAKEPGLLSGNTFGATLWSDGKQEAPMLPSFPAIVKCANCMQFYWIEDAEVIEENKPWNDEQKDTPIEWKNAPQVDWPSIDEFVDAIEKGLGDSRDKERYLRLHLWWAINDIIRNTRKRKTPPEYKETNQRNLEQLLLLLAEEDDLQSKIMQAEIYREMKMFDRAIAILSSIPEEYESLAKQLIELSSNKKSFLCKLKMD